MKSGRVSAEKVEFAPVCNHSVSYRLSQGEQQRGRSGAGIGAAHLSTLLNIHISIFH